MIVQPRVDGTSGSVAFVIGDNRRVALRPVEQLLSTDGRFQYLGGRIPLANELSARAISLAEKAIECVPGLFGYVGVDVVLGSDGRDWAIEINPRLTTSYVGLRAATRTNLAKVLLGVATGDFIPIIEWMSSTIRFRPGGDTEALV
jgi:hypothetical protein